MCFRTGLLALLGCLWVETGCYRGFSCRAGALLALGGDPELGHEWFLSSSVLQGGNQPCEWSLGEEVATMPLCGDAAAGPSGGLGCGTRWCVPSSLGQAVNLACPALMWRPGLVFLRGEVQTAELGTQPGRAWGFLQTLVSAGLSRAFCK